MKVSVDGVWGYICGDFPAYAFCRSMNFTEGIMDYTHRTYSTDSTIDTYYVVGFVFSYELTVISGRNSYHLTNKARLSLTDFVTHSVCHTCSVTHSVCHTCSTRLGSRCSIACERVAGALM